MFSEALRRWRPPLPGAQHTLKGVNSVGETVGPPGISAYMTNHEGAELPVGSGEGFYYKGHQCFLVLDSFTTGRLISTNQAETSVWN